MLDLDLRCDQCNSKAFIIGVSNTPDNEFKFELENGWVCKFLYTGHYLTICPLCIRKNKMKNIIKTIKNEKNKEKIS